MNARPLHNTLSADYIQLTQIWLCSAEGLVNLAKFAQQNGIITDPGQATAVSRDYSRACTNKSPRKYLCS